MPAPTLRGTTIEESARRVGAWAWAESQLYRVIGEWSREANAPRLVVYLDACSQHHAWRSAMWAERLAGRLVQAYPGTAQPQAPDGLVGPGSERSEAALGALGGVAGDVERLAVYTRVVLGRCAAAYAGWRRLCNPATDRPVMRVLGLVQADVVSDWEDGSRLLLDLMGPGPQPEGAAAAMAAATAEVDAAMSAEALAPGA